MRIIVRETVDVTKPVNLRELGPLEKIIVAFKNGLINTKYYQAKEQRRLDKEREQEIQLEEKPKAELFSIIYNELTLNKTLGDKDTCVEILVRVPKEYESVLDRILSSEDFLVYDKKIIKPDEDLQAAYETLPILLRISKGGLV